jgi:hypothetical protein
MYTTHFYLGLGIGCEPGWKQIGFGLDIENIRPQSYPWS